MSIDRIINYVKIEKLYMNRETGRSSMATIEFLGEILKRPHAVLILRLSNGQSLVSYDELQVGLNDRFARIDRKGPSERKVKSGLKFLVRQNLLEKVEGGYRITPRGAEASNDLSPRSETRPNVI